MVDVTSLLTAEKALLINVLPALWCNDRRIYQVQLPRQFYIQLSILVFHTSLHMPKHLTPEQQAIWDA